MQANNKYKSSVFSLLFSDPDLLRELYCALEGVNLPPNVPVTINTLNEALFMDRINDISFEIGGKLVVLFEHQSTITPNIALRMLMYIARVYEKIIGDRNIYATKRLSLPYPEFFVLYNGTAPFPDEQVLRLSGSYEKPEDLGLPRKAAPALELEVKAININHGRNEAFAQRCKTLAEYSAFVAKVRAIETECGDKAEAIRLAVKHCRDHDILKGFLEKHSTEVQNMLFTEWNWDDALAVRYEEGKEEGWEKGLEKGLEEGLEKGHEEVLDLVAKGYTVEEIKRKLGQSPVSRG